MKKIDLFSTKKIRPDIVITYPPDFDGELHIQVDKIMHNEKIFAYNYTFKYSADKESPREILLKAAMDIVSSLR